MTRCYRCKTSIKWENWFFYRIGKKTYYYHADCFASAINYNGISLRSVDSDFGGYYHDLQDSRCFLNRVNQ